MAGDSSVQVSSQEAAVRVGKGKRTGIIVSSQQDVPLKDGMEDVEAVFAAVQSPEPVAVASPGKENSTDETVKKKAVKAKKSIRFSLPGTTTTTAIGDQDTVASSSSSTTTPGKLPGIMKKFLSMGQRSSLSPSELSRVSTAPPSMDRSTVTQFDEEEEEEEEEEDIEEVRKAQEKSSEEYANVAHRRSIGSPDAFPMDVDPGMDDDFPPADDVEDDGDALVPPAPPDSPDADDLETEEVEEVEESATDVAFPAELDPDTDDDDKEGDGFNMPDDPDPETPASVREERRQDAEKVAEKKLKKKKGTKTRKLVDTSMEEEDEAPKSVPRKTKKQKKKFATNPFTPKGMPSGPREYEAVPVSDLKDSPKEGQEHLRRSKRARMTPLEYWRNEHIIYGPNDELDASDSLANMPVPKQISKALPTPYKMRKFTHRAAPAEKSGKSQNNNASKDYPSLEDEPFDSTKLRRKQDYMEAEDGNMWDEAAEESTSLRVVAYNENLMPRDLPLAKSRKKGEGKVVGQAASAFNILSDDNSCYVGYIMGTFTLPPKGIKDAESVGQCAQTFTVVTGQQGALEVSYGDPDLQDGVLDMANAQRFLLGPKDLFRIPPGNCYRLQNHSKHSECFLSWTIIRPASSA